MSYLARLREFQEKGQVEELPKLTKAPFVGFDSEASGLIPAIPPEIAMGLNRLREMRVPRISRPEVWREIVADALRLSSEGWAATAIGLGWTPLELWGASTQPDPWDDEHGLAVWLSGRTLVLIDDTMALVRDGTRRLVFNRHEMTSAQYLWEI